MVRSIRTSPVGDEIAYWTFDESTGDVLIDRTGNGHDGLNGATTQLGFAGVQGGAYYFDGMTSSGVAVPHHPAFQFRASYAVAGWFRPDEVVDDGEDDHLVGYGSQNEWHVSIGVRPPGPGLKSFYEYGADVDAVVLYPFPIGTVDTWHHFVAQYDASAGEHQLYFDGVLVEAATQPHPYITSTSLIGIGAQASGGPPRGFRGFLDELHVFGRALGPAEIGAQAGCGDPN